MKVLHDTKNGLLKRREVVIELATDSNPGSVKVTQDIADHFKATGEQVAIKKIDSEFGEHRFVVSANIYDTVAGKTKVEPKVKVKKKAEGQ